VSKLKKGSLISGNATKILLNILFLFDQIRPKNRLLYYKLKVKRVNQAIDSFHRTFGLALYGYFNLLRLWKQVI